MTHTAQPIVIAHRGASGYRPEHTRASYQLAIKHGADYVEPDLVATRDGQLIVRHENELSGTTDVAARPEYAERKTEKLIDGSLVRGWFSEDFSLPEIKTLRARERIPELRPDNTRWDGQLEILTFAEVLELATAESQARGRSIGVYPETKHPSYFRSLGLPLEEPMLAALATFTGPVCVQSFEQGNLKWLHAHARWPLVQLVEAAGAPFDRPDRSYAQLVTQAGLREVAEYAHAVGVHKELILPRGADGRSLEPTQLIEHAHAAGLKVHAWTFRAENKFLPSELRMGEPAAAGHAAQHGDLRAELSRFFALGLDGVFADHPDIAVSARAAQLVAS
jgi:glycerophosphoryl diester phosphodiesterase